MKKQLLMAALSFFTIRMSSQVTVTGGATATYSNVNAAFAAINAGTHTGAITIDITASTTEPSTPTPLAASGQGAANYTSIIMRPTAVVSISGAPATGRGVLEFDGADNITIDGDIVGGSVNRDLTIENNNGPTIAATTAIRLIGRTTLGLGATNYTITNCQIKGSTPGNDGMSGSTVANSYGIYAGANATALTTGGTGDNYDNITVSNCEFTRSYFGIYIGGTTTNTADNLNINNNIIGSAITSEKLSFKGVELNNATNSIISQNEIFELKATSSISNAGISTLGTSSNLITISRNKIYAIWSTSTGGWGAYGINLGGGNNMLILNNLIYDIITTNYSSTSTTYNAFGIRLASGTGHKVFYNSVNLYGAYTYSTATSCASAPLVVTSTAVTGLEIKNNIFNNKLTSNATTQKHVAVWFAASYNFLNATLNNNAYMVTNDANHYVGKVGITNGVGEYAGLSAWSGISQVNNPTNDNASVPPVNVNAPFIADNNLNFANNTITPIESGAITTTLTNIDYTGATRPKAGVNPNTNPDMGAYEFDGLAGVATDAGVQMLNSPAPNGCYGAAENLIVTIKNYGTASISNIPVTVIVSGAATQTSNATYTGTITAGSTATLNVATLNMLTAGTYTLNAFTTLSGDMNLPNDAMGTATRTVFPVSTLPTAVNFSGFTGANLTAIFPLWSEGSGTAAPTGTTSNWTSQTNLNGAGNITSRIYMYGTIRNDWMIGPKFTATANSQISFDAAITASGALTTYSAMGSDDMVRVMVSTDCGVTYTPIFTVSATNSLTTNFSNFIVNLAAYSGQDIIVAFQATDGPTDDLEAYDFHLDNINLFNASPIDAGVSAFLAPSTGTCYTSSENVVVTVRNYGSASISNVPVNVVVSGANTQTLTNTFAGPLAPGATANFTVGAANMSVGGTYTFNSYTSLAGDLNLFNDATIATRTVNPIISISGMNQLCVGGSPSTTLSINGAATSYTWNTSATTSSIVVSPTATTVYSVAASDGTCTATKNFTVTVTNPTITASGVAACAGTTATLTASAFAPINWFASATATTVLGTGSTFTASAVTTTTYYAEAKSTASGSIQTLFSGGNSCSGGNMFDITATNGSILIDSLDVSTTTAASSTFSLILYYKTGTYLGSETTPGNWIAWDTVNVVSAGTGNPSRVKISPSLLIPNGSLHSLFVNFPASYTNGTNLYSNTDVSLQMGAGLCSAFGGVNAGRMFNGNLYYTKVGCTSPKIPVTLTVNPSPTVTAVTTNTMICAGQSSTLIANGATTYSWNTGATTQGIVITPSVSTTYTVTGTTGGCSSSMVVTQSVSACTSVDFTAAASEGVIVYPNPSISDVKIILQQVGNNEKIEIMDALGKLIISRKLTAMETSINIAELANGVYMYRIVNASGIVKQGKLVKE